MSKYYNCSHNLVVSDSNTGVHVTKPCITVMHPCKQAPDLNLNNNQMVPIEWSANEINSWRLLNSEHAEDKTNRNLPQVRHEFLSTGLLAPSSLSCLPGHRFWLVIPTKNTMKSRKAGGIYNRSACSSGLNLIRVLQNVT